MAVFGAVFMFSARRQLYTLLRHPRRWVSNPGSSLRLEKELMDVLVCPLSKEPLRYDEATGELVCDTLRVVYPIRRGIPVLTPADGRIQDKPTTPNINK